MGTGRYYGHTGNSGGKHARNEPVCGGADPGIFADGEKVTYLWRDLKSDVRGDV